MNFNYIDALLAGVILLSLFFGWYRGFIRGLLDLARWVGSFLAALYFYQPVAGWIESVMGWEDVWNLPLAFILIAVAVSLLIQALGSYLLRRLPTTAHEHRANRFLGLIPGAINGLVTASILSALLFSMPFSGDFQETLRQSRTANRLAAYTDGLEATLSPVFEDAITRTLTRRIPINPDSGDSVELPFKVEDFRPRPDLEAEMLRLVNRERAANGLSQLEADPELLEIARRHSGDMFRRGYFSHNTPEGKSPFDRIREGGATFRTAGENLALAPTVEIAHTGLMNSPGHRANILRPQFGRVGIGILDGGRRGLMVTQNFRN